MIEEQPMAKRRKSTPSVEVGSRNVYADLGFVDADEMLVKAQLVSKISEIIEERGYSQTAAAQYLGLPQPKLSKLLRGQFRGISERKLMDCLTRLGKDIEIVVRERAVAGRSGTCRWYLRKSPINVLKARLKCCAVEHRRNC
jgi:predicted XRE-type DNA-binding protein